MPEPEERSLNDLVAAAFRKASAQAVLRARQTGTPLIVWRDGRVQAIPPDEAEDEVATPQTEASEPRQG